MTNQSTGADTTIDALTGASSVASTTRHRLVLIAVAAASVTIDLISKIWASSALPDDPREFGPLTLRLVHNRGVAFGVAIFVPPAASLPAVATTIAGWRGRLVPATAAGLIVGGAAANVADRMTGGTVVDFMDVDRWPVVQPRRRQPAHRPRAAVDHQLTKRRHLARPVTGRFTSCSGTPAHFHPSAETPVRSPDVQTRADSGNRARLNGSTCRLHERVRVRGVLADPGFKVQVITAGVARATDVPHHFSRGDRTA